MALFNKLFSTNKRKNVVASPAVSHQTTSYQFPFSGDQVRVLLYRECDWRGRRLLFDSGAVQSVCLTNLSGSPSGTSGCGGGSSSSGGGGGGGYVETIDGFGYKYSSRPTSDFNSVGDMVFGSVAMSFRGTSLKVHWTQAPAKFLCSQVFLSPVQTKSFHQHHPSFDSGAGMSDGTSSVDTSSLSSFSLSNLVANNNCGSGSGSGSGADTNSKGMTSADTENSHPRDVPVSSSSVDLMENRLLAYSAGDSGYSSTATEHWPPRPPAASTLASNSVSACRFSSTRSSFASAYSDQESLRKCSIDSSIADSVVGGGGTDTGFGGNKTSDGSMQRRILRNMSTSFENRSSTSDFIGYIADNCPTNVTISSDANVVRWRRNSEVIENRTRLDTVRRKATSGDRISPYHTTHATFAGNRYSGRRARLGLAVCITLNESSDQEMRLFCAEHITLFEAMLCRLRATAENAYINRQTFVQTMLRAWLSTARWVTDLFTAPRLTRPVWLTLNCSTPEPDDNASAIASTFMSELCWLLGRADTKDTNFFISTLVTAILTHHLGWVSTVGAQLAATDQATAATWTAVTQHHPYNALWAQLGELYGAIGNPPKIAKTIIAGSDRGIVDRILNVATYFIRCAAVKQHYRGRPSVAIERTELVAALRQRQSFEVAHNRVDQQIGTPQKCNLTRTSSFKRSMNTLEASNTVEALNNQKMSDLIAAMQKNIMNDIPNVLVYRDSRFVRQELRIGNALMDPGIVMNSKLKSDVRAYAVKTNPIRLTVTSPENVEFAVSASTSSPILEAVEATEERSTGAVRKTSIVQIDSGSIGSNVNPLLPAIPSLSDLITANSLGVASGKLAWGIEPIKESVNLEQMQHIEKGIEIANSCLNEMPAAVEATSFKRTQSMFVKASGTLGASKGGGEHMCGRSRLVRKTSVPKIGTFFDTSQAEALWQASTGQVDSGSGSGVVFVLGDNEALVGLKKDPDVVDALKKRPCTHRCQKHSGVKFNFEQYPQIATAYMRNKNLDIIDSNFLEKAIKMEREMKLANGASGSSSSRVSGFELSTILDATAIALAAANVDDTERCEFCSGVANAPFVLQTPSNASELEFSCDLTSENYHETSATPRRTKDLMAAAGVAECLLNLPLNEHGDRDEAVGGLGIIPENRELPRRRNSILSIDNGTGTGTGQLTEIIPIPLPRTRVNSTADERMVHGFVPSLMAGVTDHYIADMVLQGTSAPVSTWEKTLKHDLTLAAHCASVEQAPAENIAIVASADKWDVQVVSSQTYVMPLGNATNGPIGMSQLVASMLEIVHAMWSGGTSANHCLDYIESKLQEIYLHSETLAAFLLATEFCSLNTVTSTLNLSANDVPLLLSVASIHTPQVTKKYGISFR